MPRLDLGISRRQAAMPAPAVRRRAGSTVKAPPHDQAVVHQLQPVVNDLAVHSGLRFQTRSKAGCAQECESAVEFQFLTAPHATLIIATLSGLFLTPSEFSKPLIVHGHLLDQLGSDTEFELAKQVA